MATAHYQPKTGGNEDLGHLHVLVVDDDNTFLDFLQAMLNAIGVQHVSRATSRREAYEILLSSHRVVDVILCDYVMDAGTGLELLWMVRTGQVKMFRPDACFLLLTSSSDRDTVSAAGQLDVSGYIVKPATPDKLRASIMAGRKRAIRIDFARYKQVQLPSSSA